MDLAAREEELTREVPQLLETMSFGREISERANSRKHVSYVSHCVKVC